jgi:hypothetical protein
MRNFIHDLIHRLIKNFLSFGTIKNDPTRRAKSILFGVNSIIYSMLSVACASLSFLIGNINAENALISFLLLIFLVVAAYIAPIIFIIYSLLDLIMQLILNKKAIGWIALALFLIALPIALFMILTATNII